MSPSHVHLFEHAVDSLKRYQEQGSAHDVTLLKDAQVAMSCVLNTMSANTQDYFDKVQHPELFEEAFSLSVIDGFDSHPSIAIAQEYEDRLSKHGVKGLLKQLIVDRGILHSNYMDHDDLPPEADMRDKVLEILTKLGETMLKASKTMRHMQWEEHGDISDTGRKVDCVFMYKGIELSNIEFKRTDVGARDIAIQNRKNVRLARCIQEVHTSLGVKDPSVFMADVHGFVGIFYQASLETQAPLIQLAKEFNEVEQEKAASFRRVNRSITPPPPARRFQDHVLFTPQKKQRRKTAPLDL
ncbi:hypothetical protein BCR41DRAFT_383520 [Lobosporangium transversale]|uniref:Uncharacterized protein n=1 Tax=Lobosporangium transversale TaxID=64571 RepID=A0A1Y2H426_9FUNG|nr:hypothetical protein BCR41DRAFT_383520 [Lobosporangium transversale]ORZ27812.1 hypothetical protein BCR41DRAFT_383520 [Lobosporangium transversale]|eukprot:XP_021885515.1 hypothetical protein BCR41DRAFT_383520 [Lobosporangium transversale]